MQFAEDITPEEEKLAEEIKTHLQDTEKTVEEGYSYTYEKWLRLAYHRYEKLLFNYQNILQDWERQYDQLGNPEKAILHTVNKINQCTLYFVEVKDPYRFERNNLKNGINIAVPYTLNKEYRRALYTVYTAFYELSMLLQQV